MATNLSHPRQEVSQGDTELRLLQLQDFDKATYEAMLNSEDYCVMVVEESTTGSIVGTATLLIMRKFIHDCGKVGLIEDVVVHSDHRGKKLGQRLIEALTAEARKRGCYKVMLNCAESNVGFYTSCGYKQKEVQMVQYLE